MRWRTQSRAAIPAFVPSDFELVVSWLWWRSSRTSWRPAGGSSNGAAASASSPAWPCCVGFDAVGIEIEPQLVRHRRGTWPKSTASTTQFACGSFVPHGAEPRVDLAGDVAWLTTDGPDGYEELELEPDDFDVVFAYPWPGEEQVIFDLFADCAAVGALLLTYHGQEGVRLQRKVRR